MTAYCAYCDRPINLSKDKYKIREFPDRPNGLEVEYYCSEHMGVIE